MPARVGHPHLCVCAINNQAVLPTGDFGTKNTTVPLTAMPDSLPEGQTGSKVHHPLFLLNKGKMDFSGARLIVLLVGYLLCVLQTQV